MKLGFLFGAGAEFDYDMPSGGQFALDIFREDPSSSKSEFKSMRASIDKQTKYACKFLPNDFDTKNINSFGKTVYENIIKDTIEHNRMLIIDNINNIDGLARGIVDDINKRYSDFDQAIKNLTGKQITNINMGQTIKFSRELAKGNELFCSEYFSALLYVYKTVDFAIPAHKRSLGKIILSIIQLQLGALSEQLVRKINDNPFEKKDDDIDLFDDLGDILHLNYSGSGLIGLEYLLDKEKVNPISSDETMVLYFAQCLLKKIFSVVLDYKSLIDANWHYLYCPSAEWSKFCKISIFLLTVKNYIDKQCSKADKNKKGYYDELKDYINENKIVVTKVATTNYTDLISYKLETDIVYLNGSTNMWYDPYLNEIGTKEYLEKNEKHFMVPLLFTQSGTKPMTAIQMNKEYMEVYNSFFDSEYICSIGFGFNQDDEHINGIIRYLVKQNKKLIVVKNKNNKTEVDEAKAIAEKLKILDYDKIKVILVDKDRMVDGKLWIDELINRFSKTDYEN